MDFSKFKIQFQILHWVSADEWCVCLWIYYFFSSKLLCGSCLDRLLALMHILHVTYIQYESICHCLFCFGPHFFNCFFDEHIRAHATTNQLLFSISSENHSIFTISLHTYWIHSPSCVYIDCWTTAFQFEQTISIRAFVIWFFHVNIHSNWGLQKYYCVFL